MALALFTDAAGGGQTTPPFQGGDREKYGLTLVLNYQGLSKWAKISGSFPLVQGEGWDGVLLYALIVNAE